MHPNGVHIMRIQSEDELTSSRLADGAEVGFGAFSPDPVFRWLRPNRTKDYEERLREYFGDRIRNVAVRLGKDQLVLAVCYNPDLQREEVLGWAIWERTLSKAEEQGKDFFWGLGPQKSSASSEDAIIKRDPDPANDLTRLEMFNEAWNRAEVDITRLLGEKNASSGTANGKEERSNGEHHTALEAFPHIKLFLIAVAPKCQRMGVGRMLVEWGIREADRQGVPIVMGASPVGEGLYRKCGFVDLGVSLQYASHEEEAEYGRLNDIILVRWPVVR